MEMMVHFSDIRSELSANGTDHGTEPKKLSAPVSINQSASRQFEQVSSALFNINDRTFVKPNNEITTVSQKKLEKAEAKLKEKQEKRAREGVNGDSK